MLNFLRKLFGNDSSDRLEASRYSVTVTDTEIVNRRPDGKLERVEFASLNTIILETNDRGPEEADIWWHMIGENDAVCIFPVGARGEDDVLDKVMKLPDFNHAAFIEAMTSTENQRFLCWQRIASKSAERQ